MRLQDRERPVADDDLPTRVARELWPTAVVQDAKSAARHGYMHEGNPGTMLLDAVRAWPTPNVPNGGRAMREEDVHAGGATAAGKRQVHLEAAVRVWPTAASWATPTTPGGGAMTRSGARGDELLLPGQAASWSDYPTPSATEYGSSQNGINGKGGEFERPSAGTPSLSTAARTGALPGGKGVLNPIFVEALMGWPLGWTGQARAGAWPGFPPAPRDTEGWVRYLERAPAAVPACPKDAVEDRIDRLRACGNGVVPQQAAAAFEELFAALGVGHAHSRYEDSGGNGGGGQGVTLRDPRSHASSPSAPLRGWRNRWRNEEKHG